jgi:exopolyphosphatase/pppGpp-phosphohydrolase
MRVANTREREHHPRCSKEILVGRWVRRRLGTTGHEDRVFAIATTLFDLTRSVHGLGAIQRRLLRLASLVHDVGRSVNDENHPAEGMRMLAADSWLPLTKSERRALCYLTRYHRGAVPEVGYDEVLRPGDGRRTLRTILALLRAADTLDNRQIHNPPHIQFKLRGKRLTVKCVLGRDTPRARKAFRNGKKYQLLQEELGLKAEVLIRSKSEMLNAEF